MLYYAHSNGTFQDVRNEGTTVYYVGTCDMAEYKGSLLIEWL